MPTSSGLRPGAPADFLRAAPEPLLRAQVWNCPLRGDDQTLAPTRRMQWRERKRQ